ncbi:protein-glutamate methylesterase/protein-glutamine glutaminase [Paenibacillus beijingensis]|uniref:Protein-glutamate methylesterase/protein-glutamine glutaminase n=1 Tax=Paenibacillus beijingensis TaxID=1126833 RepID=A0A0D5NNJ4_9BACL|nr:chemotaxis response regulator protein-glutamate methylesterase [Paenibacillus beijingensis]AJY76587.1 hypothetical protein VN24_20950 [Paenibacillus beijingensis]
MSPYRIVVVDDSPFMRKIISDLINADPDFTVVATAATGTEAVLAAAEWKPDAITMDLEMPEMNGLEALQKIMDSSPLPVIMFSGISEDNTRQTIAALQFGAFDFMRKPSVSMDMLQIGCQLLEKLKIAVQTRKRFSLALKTGSAPPANNIEHGEGKTARSKPGSLDSGSGKSANKPQELPRSGKRESGPPEQIPDVNERSSRPSSANRMGVEGRTEQAPNTSHCSNPGVPEHADVKAGISVPGPAKFEVQRQTFQHLIAIGTSTGGPRALHNVITALPEDLPAPVLVVQHMPPRFTRSLAQRLDSFSKLCVTEAEHGERLAAGTVYIAPGGSHLKLGRDSLGYYISLTNEDAVCGHRPSVDVLFRSLIPHPELQRIAVIMTGMGSDGAQGMKELAASGPAVTIAEAEETCIVYGMPRCAVENGSAKAVLPLHRIAERLINEVTKP